MIPPSRPEKHLLARIYCPHGHSFDIVDACPATREDPPEDLQLPKLTRKERRALKKGKL